MSLKDYRPDFQDLDEKKDLEDLKPQETLSPIDYPQDDVNPVKIETLAKRINLIAIALPCLIGLIMLFVYLDMRGKILNATRDKQTETEKLSQHFQEQITALEVKAEKNRFDLETMDKKTVGLEGQITKLNSSKADAAPINDQIKKMDTRISNNTDQNKLNLQTIERINKELLASQSGIQTELEKQVKQVKEEVSSFKKVLESRMAEVGELQKELSQMDKKVKKLEQDSVAQSRIDEKIRQVKDELSASINRLDKQIQNLDSKMSNSLSRPVKKETDSLDNASPPTPQRAPVSEPPKPKSPVNSDSLETPSGTGIRQKTLTN